MTPPTDRTGFRIGFVTAVATEYDAIYELFDAKYDKNGSVYGKVSGDINIYSTGRIGKHEVVLLCLADAGKTNSAQAVSSLRISYPSIQYIFVVGICGGVPYYNNRGRQIHLGDVVIGTHLIEYDYGRQFPGGFKLKDTSLKVHNLEVRTLQKFLQTTDAQLDFRARVSHHLAQLSPKRSRPPASASDISFRPEYPHKHRGVRITCACSDGDDICQAALDQDCEALGCEKSAIKRCRDGSHEVQIHFGGIASADTVLKSGVDRERLADTYSVLGFEMEGAGLWDGIVSCIIVKGVCDYADSHKRKTWQDFAAGTGAAAAKTFLEQLTSDSGQSIKQHWMLPFAQNNYFTGREDEIKNLESFIAAPNGPSKLAINGLGGIGKSQIALELAHRLKKNDGGRAVFWIPCTSFETVEQGFVEITQTLELRKTTPAEAKETVKAHLSHQLTRWLLILDSVDDEDMWAFLEGFLPRSDQGRILVTTRNRRVAFNVAGTNVIEIEPPSEGTALQMLRKRLINKNLVNDTESAIAVLRRLTCLPLAIAQAAAYITRIGPNVTFSDYLDLLDQQEHEVVDLLSKKFKDESRYPNAQNPVASTWLVSFEQIRKSNKAAAMYLSLMACVNPSRIPRAFLPRLTTETDKLEALGLLNGFSFITMEHDRGHITIHRLVHLAARIWAEKDGTLRALRYRAEYELRRSFPDVDTGNQQLVRDYLPHALAVLGEKDHEFRIEPDDVSWITARCLQYMGRFGDARGLYERILVLNRKVYGNKDESTLAIMFMIAHIYYRQGQFENAEKAQLKVLELRKQVLGSDHAETISAMIQLSEIYRAEQNLEKLGPIHQQLLDFLNRTRLPTDAIIKSCKVELAATLSVLGKQQEAEELRIQAYEAGRNLPSDTNQELIDMSNLALAYQKQGRHAEAQILFRKVIDEAKPGMLLDQVVVSSMNGLSMSYSAQKNWTQAEDFGQRAIAVSKESIDPSSPHTFLSIEILMTVYLRQDKWKSAEALGVEAVDAAREALGSGNLLTLNLMSRLVQVYMYQERWSDAEKLEADALRIHKDVLGPGHSRTLDTMHVLSHIYSKQGRSNEAEALKEEAIKIEVKENGRGLDHPEVLENMHQLALTWHRSRRPRDAMELMARTAELRRKVLGQDDNATQASVRTLAGWKEAAAPGLAEPKRSRRRDRLWTLFERVRTFSPNPLPGSSRKPL